MPRRPRKHLSGLFVHVINRSVRKEPIFKRPREYAAFLDILKVGLERHPARLMAYCIMPNHWHLVVAADSQLQLSRLMHWVTVTHAVRWHHRGETVGQGPVYQGRFKSHPIEAAANLIRVVRYVERNALRARLVKRAQDWPWCSLAERLSCAPYLPLTSPPFLVSDAWVDYVNASVTIDEQLAEAARPVPFEARTVENRPVP